MAIHTITTAIQKTINSWYQAIVGEKTKQANYVKYILIGLGVASAAAGSFFSYRWYVMYRERAAYKALTNYLDDYRNVRQEQQGDWAPIEDLFKLGYEQHSNSYIAPFFLAFEADALINQNKKIKAVQVLDKMINLTSSEDPLLSLFKVKRALVKLDLDNVAKKSGVQELIDLGNDTKNKFNDIALYYLGFYYFANDKLDEAKKTWQQLVEQQKHEKIMPSPWAQQAQLKLDQIA